MSGPACGLFALAWIRRHQTRKGLDGTGVTVNAVLPGGATLTGMIPESFPEAERSRLLSPDIIIPW